PGDDHRRTLRAPARGAARRDSHRRRSASGRPHGRAGRSPGGGRPPRSRSSRLRRFARRLGDGVGGDAAGARGGGGEETGGRRDGACGGVGRLLGGDAGTLERKLVDELGGLDAALAKARSLAGLPDTALAFEVHPPKRALAPQPLPTAGALAGYLLEGVTLFNRTPVHALMELLCTNA